MSGVWQTVREVREMLLLGEKECWASRATASQVQLSQKRAMRVCACVSVPEEACLSSLAARRSLPRPSPSSQERK